MKHNEQIDSDADAHAAGFEAAFNGECETSNRYPIGTDAHLSWNDGYESFSDVQEDIRKSNATPTKVDLTLEQLEKMSMDAVAKLIGMPLSTWPGNCFAIASKLVSALKWSGATAVYGHYLGTISPACTMFYKKPLVHHGWILTGQGCIVDPTRWVFENAAPGIAVYKPWVTDVHDLEQYDEGGEQWVRKNQTPAPAFDKKGRTYLLSGAAVSPALQAFISGRLSGPGQFSMSLTEIGVKQIHWLANQPYSVLGAAAGMLYTWLKAIGLQGFVPVDFWHRAERDGQFQEC